MKKQLIRIIGMMIVGLSVFSQQFIGLWFILPWLAGWIIYDLNYKY